MYINLQEYSEFAKSDFSGDNLILHIPKNIESASYNNGRLLLKLNAAICKKEPVVISALMLGRKFSFTGKWATMNLRIEYTAVDTLRVRLCDGDKTISKPQLMLLSEPQPLSFASFSEYPEKYELATAKMRVVLYKSPYRMEVFNSDGKLLYKQYNDDMHNATNDRRRGYKEGENDFLSETNDKLSLTGFECFPFGRVFNHENGKACFTESVETEYSEAFYGFGERFSRINKNGQCILNWIVNPVGVSTNKAYKSVPFFTSNRGYGVYYNTPRKINFSMCDYFFKAYESCVEDELLDIFIFAGNIKKVLSSYSNLTGKSALPPKWALGAWMSRNCYMSQEEIETVAKHLRENSLPCDVMHIDWAYCKSFDYDFEFDKTRYENVPKLANNLLKMGIKLSVWQLPYIKKTANTYKEAAENGYLALEADGSRADTQAGEGVIDFSNNKAASWYKEKLKTLLNQGIRVIKTDFGENAQSEYVYKNCNGEDMHNLYPLYYNRLAYEACQEVFKNDSLVWGRSAYAGCQRYPVYWGGDSDSDYNGMYNSLRGGLSLGLSGFPFWSHDVGGYFCTPTTDVYIRWLQFGMLSPLVRFHGTSSREPWTFGDEAVKQYKKYAALRYSLIEYLYSESNKCIHDCTPMLRALVLDFEHDSLTADIDDEYMLGRNILVAPVFSDSSHRNVYLPSGTSWLCLHSGKWYSGGKTISVPTPIDITPVFLKGETATPFIIPSNYVDELPVDLIKWEICPVNSIANYTLKTDKLNISFKYDFNGDTGVGNINVTLIEGIKQTYHINCPDVKKIFINKQEAAIEYEENNFVIIR